ncbi:ABC transporter permease [Streptomyces sp. PRB2-1]|uniref:ABC transporter permease n=1 Tax=Actinacidiphila epipremni TaxID=2053013 RepID=A0ABX0ZI76_9ACTN|nr:ABC transporter permease [Actinacidiphila epipremni]
MPAGGPAAGAPAARAATARALAARGWRRLPRRALAWVAALAASLAVESALLFAALQAVPGDAATTLLGQNATPAELAATRHRLGLDEPAPVRYLRWIEGAVHGDLGASFQSGRPVAAVLAQPLLNSLVLAAAAFAAGAVLAVTSGLVTGLRPGSRTDTALSTASVAVLSTPVLVWASGACVVFAGLLGWLPAVSLPPFGGTPLARPVVLVLPAGTLALFGGAWAGRLIRAAVADAARLPHVEAARLAGLPRRRVLVRHLLPSALAPCAQALASMAALLVGGTAVVEQTFGYPGLGQLLVASVHDHDTPLTEGAALVVVALVTLGFAAADFSGLLADPRRGRRS